MQSVARTLVTPEIAAKWLEMRRDRQRRIRPSRVRLYAEQMRRGEWLETHEAIALSEDGELLDGQHRLEAIIQSGVSVWLNVATGVQVEAFLVIDGGLTRNLSDHLSIDPRVAQVITLAGNICAKNRDCMVTPATGRVIERVIGGPLRDLISFAGTKRRIVSSAAVKLAAVVTMIECPSQRDYVMLLYRALTQLDFDGLPPVGRAFIRVTYGNSPVSGHTAKHIGGGDAQRELLARARIVFDQRRADNKKVPLREDSPTAAAEWVRRVLLPLMEEAPNA